MSHQLAHEYQLRVKRSGRSSTIGLNSLDKRLGHLFVLATQTRARADQGKVEATARRQERETATHFAIRSWIALKRNAESISPVTNKHN